MKAGSRPWRWIAPLLAVAAVMAGCAKTNAPGGNEPAPIGPQAANATDGLTHNVITRGEEVNLEDHLEAGKITVFDFSSQFCGPCMMLAPKVAELDEKRDDLVVKTVDINRPGQQGIDWDSPVARQYGMTSIPAFVIYGPDGKKQAEGGEARAQVEQWISE